MQKQFFIKLFIVIFLAFWATFIGSFLTQTYHSRHSGVEIVALKIEDIKSELKNSERNLDTIRQMINATAIAKANAVALIVLNNPKIINDVSILEILKQKLDVDEIHISDDKGILIASIPVKYKGFDMNSSEQTKEFMPAISNKTFTYVQDPMLRGIKDDIFQYAAVARLDKAGIVEIGYNPKRLTEAQKLADIANIAKGFRIGRSGNILIIKDDKIISYGIDNYELSDNEENQLLNFAQIHLKPFDLIINGVEHVGLADAYLDYKIVGVLPKNELYLTRNSMLKILLYVNIILFSLIFLFLSLLLKDIVISKIFKVNKALQKITEGDLNERVDVRHVEEFEMLSDGINTTVDALKLAIEKEAKRLDTELNLAKSIQISALPRIFPPYPEHKEFEIYARMDPAREVGGDFYDFFMSGANRLGFLVADVSGKGIPSALFMMKSKTLIHNIAKTGIDPAEMMTKVNHQVSKSNEEAFFVTVFYCELELSTGILTCVNAGHNPPLIKRANGEVEVVGISPNIVVGAINEVQYSSTQIKLNKGDTILLYTDGVTEANNDKDEFYGDDRLLGLVKNELFTDKNIEQSLKILKEDIDKFANGAAQFDDITTIALRYNG
ncbi:MAG: SpoIIE family protein phosphatase [Candidatus Gastranaerophilales bacterium]